MVTDPSVRRGDIWTMSVARAERLALVISSDMFNLESGLNHVLTMLVAPEAGPYSFPLPAKDPPLGPSLHVWTAHLDSTPTRLLRDHVGVVQHEVIDSAHMHLLMILNESTAPL